MGSEDSVTRWVDRLRTGDAAAASRLWDDYFRHMVELARRRMRGLPCRWADEEDVALSAFKSFCRGAADGRFAGPIDRDSLWPLLFALTARKVVDLVRHENRRKRGGGPPAEVDLEGLPDREWGPDFAAQVGEECARLLEGLGDPLLRSVAEWKMEGFTSAEIARRLGCTERTVERKLRVIRRLWREEDGA
jgi:DNA-directed RNA polymerase specialized sigma24 family protein